MKQVFRVTIVEQGLERVFLVQAESFDEAYKHIREEHAIELILKIEQIISVRDL